MPGRVFRCVSCRNKINTVFHLKQFSLVQKINISESLGWREQIANSKRGKQEVNLLALIRRCWGWGRASGLLDLVAQFFPSGSQFFSSLSLLSFTMPASSQDWFPLACGMAGHAILSFMLSCLFGMPGDFSSFKIRKDFSRNFQQTSVCVSLTRNRTYTYSWQNHWPMNGINLKAVRPLGTESRDQLFLSISVSNRDRYVPGSGRVRWVGGDALLLERKKIGMPWRGNSTHCDNKSSNYDWASV